MVMPSFLVGQRVTAAQLELMARQIDSLTAPGWTDYSGTFTITASVTPPTKGSSTYVARYRRPANADRIDVQVQITIGAGFAAGSGVYHFLLPVAAAAGQVNEAVGDCWIFDNTTAHRQAVPVVIDATHFDIALSGNSAYLGSGGSGTAWATGDIIAVALSYQPA